ncbi:MAG: NADH-quinone oxidoreductase subunit H, partial [Victivallales bacterium]
TVLGALDTGSRNEGMGAGREAMFAVIGEPGFFIIMSSLAYMGGCRSFSEIFEAVQAAETSFYPCGIIAAVGLFIFMLADSCRMPVDDPATHLELTMVHEVMVLDNSGPSMAFITYGAALRIFLVSSIIAGLFLPAGMPLAGEAVLYILSLFASAVVIGAVESIMARMRMVHVPQFLFIVSALGMLLFFIALMGRKGLS